MAPSLGLMGPCGLMYPLFFQTYRPLRTTSSAMDHGRTGELLTVVQDDLACSTIFSSLLNNKSGHGWLFRSMLLTSCHPDRSSFGTCSACCSQDQLVAALSGLWVGSGAGDAAACVPVPAATPDEAAGSCSSASPSPVQTAARSKVARSRMLLDSSDEEDEQGDAGSPEAAAWPDPVKRIQLDSGDSGDEHEQSPAVPAALAGGHLPDEVPHTTGSSRGFLRRGVESSSDEDADTDGDNAPDARMAVAPRSGPPTARRSKAIVISDESDSDTGQVANDDADAGSGSESLDGFIVYSSDEGGLSEAEEQESYVSDDAWPSPAVGKRAAVSSSSPPWNTPATANRSPLAPRYTNR